MARMIHQELVEKALSNPKVKAEYDLLEAEFSVLRQLIAARKKAKMTQKDVAKLMGTTTSVVGRLESFLGSMHHSPSLSTLNRYVAAINCHLEIKVLHNS